MKTFLPLFSANLIFKGKVQFVVLLVLFLASSYFAYFYMLTTFPVQLWDEGMFAVQAIEMMENNNWLIQYFNGIPDSLNNKPPFSVWCIAISFKLLGINEFALRFPSALFGLLTATVLFYFVWKYTGNLLYGFLAAMILNASKGFTGIHICKTGEADAILTFFVTVFLISFYLYIENEDARKRRTYLIVFTLCITLASLTKSVVALLVLPAILMFIILNGKLIYLLKSREIYFSILFFIGVNAFYYLLREYYDPGNLKLVLERDILRRYFDNLGHNDPFFTYFENLIYIRYIPWIYFFPLCALIGLYSDKYKNISLYLVLNFMLYLLIISFSGTKLFWYDEILYPLGAIIIALGFGTVLQKLSLSNISQLFFCIFILAIPVQDSIGSTYKLRYLPQEDESRFNSILSLIKEKDSSIENLKVLYKVHPSHLLFYKKVLEDSIFRFSITSDLKRLGNGSVVVVCDKSQQRSVEVYYDFEVLYSVNDCMGYKIKNKRNDFLERRFMKIRQEALNNTAWMFNIKQKALAHKISVDQQLAEDVIYLLKETNEITEEEADTLRKIYLIH